MKRFVQHVLSLSVWGVTVLPVACGGVDDASALGEPLVLRSPAASFKPGPLPGLPPGSEAAGLPTVTFVEVHTPIFFPQIGERTLPGRASPGTVAVAVRFADHGSGYWTLPVGSPDATNNHEMTWEFGIGIDHLPSGFHTLLFVAIDADGQAGVQRSLQICLASPLPDNLNSCEPSIDPPSAVLSLSWDTGADLDLEVFTPSGEEVKSRSPVIGGSKDNGYIDRDAHQGCNPAGVRRESLIWPNRPAPGMYLVYVNMFDACDEASANFKVSLHLAQSQGDGTHRLVETQWVQQGTLLPLLANGGAAKGLYVGTFTF